MGLCVLHRHRGARERSAGGPGPRGPGDPCVAIQGARILSARRSLTCKPFFDMQSYDARPVPGIAGAVPVPGDKSISPRSVMLAGIAQGTSEVAGFLPSEDCLASMR